MDLLLSFERAHLTMLPGGIGRAKQPYSRFVKNHPGSVFPSQGVDLPHTSSDHHRRLPIGGDAYSGAATTHARVSACQVAYLCQLAIRHCQPIDPIVALKHSYKERLAVL